VIPSLELAVVFNMFESLIMTKNFPLIITGGDGTQKSTIIQSILTKKGEIFRPIHICINARNNNIKAHIEKFWRNKRQNVMVPIDMKRNLIIIDDLHLEQHYKHPPISEFFANWIKFKGYFTQGLKFQQISNFGLICTVNTDTPRGGKAYDMNTRLLYYSN
jgi:hypothetical protein